MFHEVFWFSRLINFYPSCYQYPYFYSIQLISQLVYFSVQILLTYVAFRWSRLVFYVYKYSLGNHSIIYRGNRLEVFCRKGVHRNFAKLTGKQLCQSLFFNKVAGLRPATLLKKRLWHSVFLRISKNNFFYKTPSAASACRLSSITISVYQFQLLLYSLNSSLLTHFICAIVDGV